MSASLPMQRTLAALRAAGYRCAIVEKYNAHIRRKQDLFGFGDVLAIKAGAPHLIVQTTRGGDVARRVTKILTGRWDNSRGEEQVTPEIPEAALDWLASNGRIEVHGWAKRGRGARKLWTCRVVHITEDQIRPDEESEQEMTA